MPVTSPSILSSIALNSSVSSSIASSCGSRTGTRSSVRPVRMIRRTACGQPPDRLQRRLRGQPSAGERDDDDRQRDEAERGAKSRQQVVARFGALAHLHERAVRQPQRRGLERRRIPALAAAEHDRFDAAIDDAHEQPLGRGLLLGAHGVGERAEAAAP